MKRLPYLSLVCCLLGVLSYSCNTLKRSVLYGNRDLADFGVMEEDGVINGKTRKDTVSHMVRLYFDREGLLYPPKGEKVQLNDFVRENSYTFLVNEATGSKRVGEYLALLEKTSFADYARLYHQALSSPGSSVDPLIAAEFREKFDSLSMKKYVAWINDRIEKCHYESVTFVMAGFNNTLINPENAFNSSETKLRLSRLAIQDVLSHHNAALDSSEAKKRTLFVEVHWDGKFTAAPGLKTMQNYRPALRTSFKVGLALRKLIGQLADSTDVAVGHDPVRQGVGIRLISHSSGANIVCEAMFNQISKVKRQGKEHELWNYLNGKYTAQSDAYRTPNRRVVAGLLAPSIPGVETFADYDKRGRTSAADNYRVVVGYNLNDPALRKQFGGKFIVGRFISFLNSEDRLVKRNVFSSTSLGCLEPEVERVKDLFRKSYTPENIRFVDFSFQDANGYKAANAIHPMEQYITTPQYAGFIGAIYQLDE